MMTSNPAVDEQEGGGSDGLNTGGNGRAQRRSVRDGHDNEQSKREHRRQRSKQRIKDESLAEALRQ